MRPQVPQNIIGVRENQSRCTYSKLTVKDIAMFSGLQQDFDISKAKRELGFAPGPSAGAVKDAMLYLKANAQRFNIRLPKP
jgi:hypothetical protein